MELFAFLMGSSMTFGGEVKRNKLSSAKRQPYSEISVQLQTFFILFLFLHFMKATSNHSRKLHSGLPFGRLRLLLQNRTHVWSSPKYSGVCIGLPNYWDYYLKYFGTVSYTRKSGKPKRKRCMRRPGKY